MKTMTKEELIKALEQVPDGEDIYIMDNEYGPTETYNLAKVDHYAITENGRQLPRQVWVLC